VHDGAGGYTFVGVVVRGPGMKKSLLATRPAQENPLVMHTCLQERKATTQLHKVDPRLNQEKSSHQQVRKNLDSVAIPPPTDFLTLPSQEAPFGHHALQVPSRIHGDFLFFNII